jgi:hypothetical protein
MIGVRAYRRSGGEGGGMDEGGLTGFIGSAWVWVLAAFLFGILIGYLIRRGRRPGEAPDQDASPEEAAPPPAGEAQPDAAADPCPATMKLGAAESEIRTARKLLAEGEAEAEQFVAELSVLDEAIKRINGRLKSILSAVKKLSRR